MTCIFLKKIRRNECRLWRMLFNNICGAVWIGRFNIMYMLLKRIGHFECSDVYGGTYVWPREWYVSDSGLERVF